MVQPVVPNQELPIVPSHKVLSWPLLDHVLSREIGSYHLFLNLLQILVGIWDGILVEVRRSSPASRLLYWPKIRIFQVSPQGESLVRSSRVANLGGSDPFWYLNMSFGERCPMVSSLVGEEGSDRVSESGSKAGSLVGWGPGSGVIFT